MIIIHPTYFPSISHFVAISNADKIILIENGKIVESGSHEELMNQDGFYKVMFNTQASLYKHKNENECKK